MNDPGFAQYGGGYNRDQFCGGADQFKCNPTLFPGADNNGLCVNMGGTYANLTDKCEAQSKKHVEKYLNDLKNGPNRDKKLEELANFNKAIFGDGSGNNGFCNTFG